MWGVDAPSLVVTAAPFFLLPPFGALGFNISEFFGE
jgi:hypothetical protein